MNLYHTVIILFTLTHISISKFSILFNFWFPWIIFRWRNYNYKLDLTITTITTNRFETEISKGREDERYIFFLFLIPLILIARKILTMETFTRSQLSLRNSKIDSRRYRTRDTNPRQLPPRRFDSKIVSETELHHMSPLLETKPTSLSIKPTILVESFRASPRERHSTEFQFRSPHSSLLSLHPPAHGIFFLYRALRIRAVV